MRLIQLEASNFRGIKSCDILFPLGKRMICMIGPGDGTKTTILKAIELVLWPSWNLLTTDTDFYNSNTAENIVIRGTFTDISAPLLSEEKFGLYLRRPGILIRDGVEDEPIDGQPLCLTIQLIIDSSLEPRWEVVCNRKEPKIISYTERQLLSVGCVGSNCERDMAWSRFSVLQKYANSKGIVHKAFTGVLREAAAHADFARLDEVSATITSIGEKYGVELDDNVRNKLVIQNSSISSSVGLFEGGAPLSQRGLGSQRLLSMGLNINATADGAVLLIDEVETGLEPYRIRSLINEFRSDPQSDGQIIMTTHSPVVVAECTIDEMLIIKSENGITTACSLHSIEGETNENLQKELRRNPEAFLCRRLIVCEGKTEIGFIRALDNYVAQNYRYRMACEGVGTALGGGDQVFSCAKILAKCGYSICVFMDSDLKGKEESKVSAKAIYNISTFDWDSGNSIEEQLFLDAGKEIAEDMLRIAVNEKGIEVVKTKLEGIPFRLEKEMIKLDELSKEQLRKIGSISKQDKASWYKRIDLGEQLGRSIFGNWDDIGANTTLHKTINGILTWVRSNE